MFPGLTTAELARQRIADLHTEADQWRLTRRVPVRAAPRFRILHPTAFRRGSHHPSAVVDREIHDPYAGRKHTVAIRTTIPAINHVAVTVTDLAVSRAWSTTVLDVEPVVDQDTGPVRPTVHQQGTTMPDPPGFPDLRSDRPFDERIPGLGHISWCAGDH